MPLKVMVSSVRRGLADVRDAVRPLLDVLGYESIRFEDLTAQPVPPRAVCVDAVDRCDIYLLLLGEHYGDPTPDSGLAPTAEEWAIARARGKPIVAFRKEGMAPEPRQAEFIAEVETYATGVFRGTFNDVDDLLGKLRDPLAAAAATLQPMRPRRLASPVAIAWRRLDRLTGATGGVTLETHVVPIGDPDPLRPGSFAELSRSLARAGRDHGLFGEGDALQLPTTETGVAAEVDRTSRRPPAGLAVATGRTVTVWEALPSQMGGTAFDEAAVRSRVARDIRLAAAVDLLAAEEATVAIGFDRVAMLGRATGPNSMEYPFFARGGEPVRVEPVDAFPTVALPRIADEIAADLVSRLVLRLQSGR